MLGPALGAAPLQGLELLGVFFSFVAAFAVLFVFEISPIVGTRDLRNILLGRYHRPRVEERFFLFVDVEGSIFPVGRVWVAQRGPFRAASAHM